MPTFGLLSIKNCNMVLHSESLGLKYEWERGLFLSWYMYLGCIIGRRRCVKPEIWGSNPSWDTNFSLNICHPSLSLLKGPSLKIRKRTTLTQKICKLFMAVLSLPTWQDYNRQQIAWWETNSTRHCKNKSQKFNCDIVQLELFVTRLFKSRY